MYSPGDNFLHSPTGYGPSSCVKKLCIAWAVSEMNMVMSREKIFVNVLEVSRASNVQLP